MKFARPGARDRVSSPDITPLVDVVFLLIIFFLTTSTLVQATVAEVDLPEQVGNRDAETRERGLVINIDARGGFIVDGAPSELNRVLAMIEAESRRTEDVDESLRVLVRADGNAPMTSLNALAEGLVDLGVRSWRLATRAPRIARSGGEG
jgi:biopolymer transport protein ExbD